jgi:hypothetical protein
MKGSSGAVPFTTMLVIVLIWFVISVPLSVAGSWIGLKQIVRHPLSPFQSLMKTATDCLK